MKKILLLLLLSSSINIFSQVTKLDSVIAKLKKDKRAYEQYLVLGRMYSYKIISNNNNIFLEVYADLIVMDPFARFFDIEILKKEYKKVLNSNGIYDLPPYLFSNNRKKSYYFSITNKINKIWSKNRKTKKLYIDFVSNKKNHISYEGHKNDIYEELFNDYLYKYYFTIMPFW